MCTSSHQHYTTTPTPSSLSIVEIKVTFDFNNSFVDWTERGGKPRILHRKMILIRVRFCMIKLCGTDHMVNKKLTLSLITQESPSSITLIPSRITFKHQYNTYMPSSNTQERWNWEQEFHRNQLRRKIAFHLSYLHSTFPTPQPISHHHHPIIPPIQFIFTTKQKQIQSRSTQISQN